MAAEASFDSAQRKRVHSIQAMRGGAAGLVVLAHAIEHAPGPSVNAVLLTGRFGVEIFFVISGFVIAHVSGNGPFRPGAFFARRIWRVAPLYWALTLLVAAAALLTPHAFKTTKFDAFYLIKSLVFVPAPVPGVPWDYRPIFKLGWTLNYEIFFYILVMALFWCGSMKKRVAILAAVLIALAGASCAGPMPGLVHFYLNLNLLPFAIGAVAALAWNKGFFDHVPQILRLASSSLALAATIGFYFVPFDQTKVLAGHWIMTLAAALIVMTALAYERRARSLKTSEWLGDISYSLYLTHMFIVGACWAILNRFHVSPYSLVGAAAVMSIFVAAVIVAHLTYKFFERPLMRIRIGGRRSVAPEAVA